MTASTADLDRPGAALTPERWLILVPLSITATVFYPIIRNFFYVDDFYNTFLIVDRGFVEFVLTPSAGHILLIRNAIWYALFRLFGMHPEPYFWTVLATHLACVGLLFEVLRLRTQSARLACVGAAFWGSASTHAESLGWYSVYGHVLAGTILTWVLLRLSQVASGRTFGRDAAVRWALLLLAACTSFGVGIGFTLVFPAVALLFLPPSPIRRKIVLTFAAATAALPLLYWGQTHLYRLLYPDGARNWLFPPHGARAWGHVLWFTALLVAHGLSDLLGGTHVAYAAAALAALTCAALWRAPGNQKRAIAAMFLLCLGCYGIIALGRGTLPKITAETPRYHYAGTVPLAILVCLTVAWLRDWRRIPAALKTGLTVAAIGYLVVSRTLLGTPIDHHDEARLDTIQILTAIRRQIDAGENGRPVFIDNRAFRGVALWGGGGFPGWAGLFAIYHPSDFVDGKRIYFVVPPHSIKGRQGRRARSLLVSARPRRTEDRR